MSSSPQNLLSLGCESATLIDIYDATSTTNRHPLTPDDGSNDATKYRDAPWFFMAQLRTGFVWLFQLVVALIVQVTVMAADIVALKTRIIEVEGAQVPAFVHHEIERLRQVIDTLQRSMACQVNEVKMDASRKITLLQSELTAIREELASVQMVALPVDISAAAQAVKEARMSPILTSTAQRTDNGKTKIEKTARKLACATTSSPAMTLSRLRKPEDKTIRTLKTTKEPLATACPNVVRPGANKIFAKSIGREIPTQGGGKENNPRDSTTKTSQRPKPSTGKPSVGRATDVEGKAHAASPLKKAQPGAGLPLKVSALPGSRKSTPPAPQISPLPDVVKHVVGDDGSSSNGSSRSTKVKPASRRPRESGTRTTQPKTVELAPIATSSAPLEEVPTQVQEPRAVLPPSSSLAALDAFLEAMGHEEYLLMSTPMPNCLDYDLSFSMIPSIPMITKEEDKSANASPEKVNTGIRPFEQNSTGENPTENDSVLLLAASSSLAALDAAFLERQDDCNLLTLTPGPDFHNAMLELSF